MDKSIAETRNNIMNIKNLNMDLGPRTSNDDRSDSLNPNNDRYWDQMDNHANLQNPNIDNYDEDYNSSNR